MTTEQLLHKATAVREALAAAVDAMTDDLQMDFSVYSLMDMTWQIDGEIDRLNAILAAERAAELEDLNREYERSRI